MNSNPLSIADLVNEPTRWSGTFFIQCQLLVDGFDQCWLAENYDDFVAGRRIAISNSKRIADLLDEIFPPWGGGYAAFIAECTTEIDLDRGVIRSLSKCDLRDRHYHLKIDHFAAEPEDK
jgi:hypothetical protein